MPDDQSGSRPGRESLRRLCGLLLLAGAAALCVCYGLARAFSGFQPYDDEGNMLLSIKQFNEGHILYDEIFCLYGPLSFLIKRWIAAAIHRPIDHDTGRLICLAYWLATAATGAGVLFQLTRSTALAACGLVVGFWELGSIIWEPGHPQELCVLLLALSILVPTWANSRGRTSGVMLGLGLLCGCLVMTKINIGIFLAMALGMTFLALGPRTPVTRILTALYVACLLIAPSLLMNAYLASPGYWQFSVTVTFSLAAAVILCLGSARPVLFSLRQWAIFTGAFLLAILAVIAATRLYGSSLEGIIRDSFQRGSTLPLSFALAPPHRKLWLPAPVAAVAVALFVVRGRFGLATALARIVFGLLVVVFAFLSLDRYLYFLGPPLAAFVLVPSAHRERGGAEVFTRTLLAFSAITEAMWAFPVYGSQRVFATFLCVAAAIVCLHDGAADFMALRQWQSAAAQRRSSLARVALVSILLVAFTARTIRLIQVYKSNPPLDLPGARLIHLPPDLTRKLRGLTEFLRANSDTFITFPGINSFYLWTGKEPPMGLTVSGWMLVLDDRLQDRIVDDLSKMAHPYVVFDRPLIEVWKWNNPQDSHIYQYVNAQFAYLTTVQGYEIWAKKETATTPPDAIRGTRSGSRGGDSPKSATAP